MERPEQDVEVDPDSLPLTKSRWRQCLQQALREVRLREIASLWDQLGAWLRRVKPYRTLLKE